MSGAPEQLALSVTEEPSLEPSEIELTDAQRAAIERRDRDV